MRLLDRYMLRELLLPLAYCLCGFSISFVAFDLFDKLSDLQKAKLGGAEILEYYVNRLPEFLINSYVMPLSLLLAMLYALTNHGRHNEITAMRAAAIPLWRIAMPYFAVGIAFSLAAFYMNEKLLPEGVDAAERLRTQNASDQKATDKIWRRNLFFVNAAANRSWRIGAYHVERGIMVKPSFDWRRPDGTRLQLHADEARWRDGQWVFSNNVEQLLYGREVGALPDVSRTNVVIIPEITETPRVIKSEIKISALNENFRSLRRVQLSSAEILDYLELHPRLPRKQAYPLRTLLHSRLAAPWICLVVVFIAVPFGAIPGRRNVFVGVASSVFICFLFLMMKDLSLAFGSRGLITPAFAAWLPNILFTLTGALLMWRVR